MTITRLARASALAALSAAALAAPMRAQATTACDIETRKPYQLASAVLYTAKHDGSFNDDDKAKLLKQAVKVLTDNPDRIGNPVGRNYLLAQIYVRWFQDQGAKPHLTAKRGDVGFSQDPDGTFNIVDALDEALTVVERERPVCADSTARYRAAVFGRVLNSAIAFYNAKSYDSATAWANLAIKVHPRAAQIGSAYTVIGNSAQAKGDLAGAITSLEAAIARMGNDPASAPSRATATYNLAIIQRDHSMKLEGEARQAGLRKAAGLFKAYLDLAPNGDQASTARAAYARSLQDAGDNEAVAGVYSEMVANPAKYTAIQLFEAGVVQANARKYDDAAKLYEAGLAQNPSYRDALFNLTNVYFAMKQPEKMAPVVERLRAVDPMNPDVLKLVGAVWQERGRQTTDAKAKKTAQDSVIAYIERAGKLPARVTVTQFSTARDGKVTLAGAVENLGAAPASFTVNFELVDKAGAVVARTEVKAEAIAAKGTKEFNAQMPAATAVAWRYTFR